MGVTGTEPLGIVSLNGTTGQPTVPSCDRTYNSRMATLTLLGAGDEAELDAFLVAHADSSLFLRGNLRRGLVDRGERLQGTYVAARDDADIVAVAAHFRNGWLVVQGQLDIIGDLARDATARSGRGVKGINGPYAQVVAARAALGLERLPARLDSREGLFALALADLRVPPPLNEGRWTCRHPVAEDRIDLARWSYGYEVESLNATPSPEDEQRALAELEPDPSSWVPELVPRWQRQPAARAVAVRARA